MKVRLLSKSIADNLPESNQAVFVRHTFLLILALIATFATSPAIAELTITIQQSEEEAAAKDDAKKDKEDKKAKFDFFDNKAPIDIEQLREMQDHFRELAAKVNSATVNIQVGRAQGSGVIVSRDGYIMTAAHVIGGANRDAWVQLGDKRLKAKTLGLNRTIDAGLAKIVEPGKYEYLELGESESLAPGQWVMAIGPPGGFDEDRGLVYRIGRILRRDRRTIATDCALVGGDSGGPLVDMDGAVIGIHSRIGGSLTNNFHVPVDTYTTSWDDLASAKDWGEGIGGRNRANDPWLGFVLKGNTMEIETVTKNGPADKAGLKPGDIILELGKSKVQSQFRLQRLRARLKPKEKIKIKYKRDDEESEAELIVGSQDKNPNRR